MADKTIATELTRIENAKSDIKASIKGKGVNVPDSTLIDGYSDLIDQIDTKPELTGDAAVGNVLSGKTFYSNSYTKQTGTMPNNGAVSKSIGYAQSYTIPAGYHNGSGEVTNSVEAGVVTSGSADVTSLTYTYNSTSGKFDVTGSKVIGSPTVSKEGYISSTVGTRNTSTATVTTTANKVGTGVDISNGGAVTPTISKQSVPSGVTDASDGSATTTAPSSGVYVAVKSGANTKTLTATPKVTSAGYGTTTSGQYSATAETSTVGANASSTTYVKVKGGSATGNAGTATYKSHTQDSTNKKKFTVTETISAPAPSVSAGWVASGAAGSGVDRTVSLTITDDEAQAAVGGTTNVVEKAGSISSDGTAYTQGKVTVDTAGYIPTGDKVLGATFKNTATSGVTYKDISATGAAPVLKTKDYLYIDKGYTDNVKISLSRLVPDGASSATDIKDGMRQNITAYDSDGNLITGSMVDVSPAFDGGGLSGSNITGIQTKGNVTIAESGSFFTSSDYGVTTTKPSGTDGTDYLTVHETHSATAENATGSTTISRAAVLYNGAAKGYIDKDDNTTALSSGSKTVTATISVTPNVTDNFEPYYIPVATTSKTDATASASVSKDPTASATATAGSASTTLGTDLYKTTATTGYTKSVTATGGDASASSASGTATASVTASSASVSAGITKGVSTSTTAKSATSTEKTASDSKTGSTTTYYIKDGKITNNTSGGTSAGTINRGNQIKIEKGLYTADAYYTAQANSGTKTITSSGTTSVDGYVNASVRSASGFDAGFENSSEVTVGALSSGYYPLTNDTTIDAGVSTAGWFSSGSKTIEDAKVGKIAASTGGGLTGSSVTPNVTATGTASGFTASSTETGYYVTSNATSAATSGSVSKAAVTAGYTPGAAATSGTVTVNKGTATAVKTYIPTTGITASVNSLINPTVGVSGTATGFEPSTSTTSYYVTVNGSATDGSVKAYAKGNGTGMVSTSTTNKSGASAITPTINGNGDKIYIPAGSAAASINGEQDGEYSYYYYPRILVTPGYVTSGSTGEGVSITPGRFGLTALAAQTITPGTTDQTIAKNKYTTGVQTIKGDANLVAANIAKDVTIFGVKGTHQGGITPSGTLKLTSPGSSTSPIDVTDYAGVYTDRSDILCGAQLDNLSSQGASSTNVSSQYFKITPYYQNSTPGWTNLETQVEGTVKNYKVTSGSAGAPTATVTGSSSSLSSTTAMNNQYFSVTPKAGAISAGWISSQSNGSAVNYKIKDGTIAVKASTPSVTGAWNSSTNKYVVTATAPAPVDNGTQTAGWVSSASKSAGTSGTLNIAKAAFEVSGASVKTTSNGAGYIPASTTVGTIAAATWSSYITKSTASTAVPIVTSAGYDDDTKISSISLQSGQNLSISYAAVCSASFTNGSLYSLSHYMSTISSISNGMSGTITTLDNAYNGYGTITTLNNGMGSGDGTYKYGTITTLNNRIDGQITKLNNVGIIGDSTSASSTAGSGQNGLYGTGDIYIAATRATSESNMSSSTYRISNIYNKAGSSWSVAGGYINQIVNYDYSKIGTIINSGNAKIGTINNYKSTISTINNYYGGDTGVCTIDSLTNGYSLSSYKGIITTLTNDTYGYITTLSNSGKIGYTTSDTASSSRSINSGTICSSSYPLKNTGTIYISHETSGYGNVYVTPNGGSSIQVIKNGAWNVSSAAYTDVSSYSTLYNNITNSGNAGKLYRYTGSNYVYNGIYFENGGLYSYDL